MLMKTFNEENGVWNSPEPASANQNFSDLSL